jgi:siroheme synthase
MSLPAPAERVSRPLPDPFRTIFMGLRRLDRIAEGLMRYGRPRDEPAAAISKVSLPDSKVVVATLESIAGASGDPVSPTIVVVGAVAALGLTSSWTALEGRPPSGDRPSVRLGPTPARA